MASAATPVAVSAARRAAANARPDTSSTVMSSKPASTSRAASGDAPPPTSITPARRSPTACRIRSRDGRGRCWDQLTWSGPRSWYTSSQCPADPGSLLMPASDGRLRRPCAVLIIYDIPRIIGIAWWGGHVEREGAGVRGVREDREGAVQSGPAGTAGPAGAGGARGGGAGGRRRDEGLQHLRPAQGTGRGRVGGLKQVRYPGRLPLGRRTSRGVRR